jgi:hypothetical protein
MSNYTKTVNFAAKDALTTGDANKVVKGTEIDTEFNNIATAIATKADSSSGGGTVTSVSGSGGTTGLTLTGGPITTTGTLTLGGTLAVANGGTGSATLAGAGIVLTTGTQSIAGTKTFTGAITLGDSAVTQVLTFNNQSNFIASAGGGGFGQTSPNANYALFVQPRASTGVGGLVTQDNSGSFGYLAFTSATGTALITLNYGNLTSATQVGSITTNGSATTYGTSSDYRLKENIVPLANAVTRLKQLAPKTFTWKNNSNLGNVDGFIAHELQAVVSEAVHGEKDGVDKDGKPKYQSVDASFIIPMLTSALQEALARIEALEAKVG